MTRLGAVAAVGEVPLEWYKDELHIGYDREGRKVAKGPRQDKLDALLARNDGGSAWRTVYDEYNGEEITLSKEEMRMIQRIREGKFPHVEVCNNCFHVCNTYLIWCKAQYPTRYRGSCVTISVGWGCATGRVPWNG